MSDNDPRETVGRINMTELPKTHYDVRSLAPPPGSLLVAVLQAEGERTRLEVVTWALLLMSVHADELGWAILLVACAVLAWVIQNKLRREVAVLISSANSTDYPENSSD